MSRLMVVLLAVAVTVPALFKSRPGAHVVTPAAFSVYSAAGATVRIDGEVMHPGVYVVGANIMTDGVIALAEPRWKLGRGALRSGNKISPVTASVIHVTRNADDSVGMRVGAMSVAERMVLGMPLDIRYMSATDLERLPGIGPVLARRIVAWRQYNGGRMGVEDLLSVSGIGEKKYDVLKKFF